MGKSKQELTIQNKNNVVIFNQSETKILIHDNNMYKEKE